MRFWLTTVFATALLPAVPLAKAFDQSAMCDSPPCSREELQRYERQVIKHMQRANALAFEAQNRGEKETAERLRKVFKRNWDRRGEIQKAIDSTPD